MKINKKVVLTLFSAILLTACSSEGSANNQSTSLNSENAQTTEGKSEKHEAVKLPVEIYVDNEYGKLSGVENTFIRSITDVEIRDFTDSEEIEFIDRYDNALNREINDLKGNYKLLDISMKHETTEDVASPISEPYMWNEGSGLVIGDKELGNQNEILQYQQNYVSTDYRVGQTFDLTGNIYMAIPNEFSENEDLQLKVVQKLNNESKYVYIDLY